MNLNELMDFLNYQHNAGQHEIFWDTFRDHGKRVYHVPRDVAVSVNEG